MAKIGVFDSGYGGLTILEKMRHALPQYDYIYLGDNARTPYGTRSFEVIYEYTWQCVRHLLLHENAALVVVACNTASARALRNIQQLDLLKIWEQDGSDVRRVLGVIRPTVERVSAFTRSKHVGVLATPGTVASESYILELEKQDPSLIVTQEACPMWVPLIENAEHTGDGADYFVKKYVDEILCRDPEIDTLILGCTHYPLLRKKIEAALPAGVHVLAQGDLVASALTDYLERHKALEEKLDKNGTCEFLTTEHPEKFRQSASVFLNDLNISAKHIDLQ
ncbi:MAG: glutamate racemase [Bacteroidales bacterium]|jgi:glutamate racemase|nr:glutamate racemase [Bacteroidales bacterium]MBR4546952.1 glutamate racemase [Paludibacteraceae bacterium]